jgi:hypothetical protein
MRRWPCLRWAQTTLKRPVSISEHNKGWGNMARTVEDGSDDDAEPLEAKDAENGDA